MICQAVDQNNTFVFLKPSPERELSVINSSAEFSQLSDRVTGQIFEAIFKDEQQFQHQLLLWSDRCFYR